MVKTIAISCCGIGLGHAARDKAIFDKIRRNYIAFCKILDKIKPNLVITDLEPYAFLYAYRRNIPVIVLSNVIATLNNYDGLPERIKNNSLALQGFMLRQFVQFMLNRGTLFVEPS